MSKHDPKRTTPKLPKRRPAAAEQPDEEREPAQHQGATEADVTPMAPPARGPAEDAGRNDQDDEIDPTDELTPG